MPRKYIITISVATVIIFSVVVFSIFIKNNAKIKKFGPLKLGGEMPLGEGYNTFAPARIIPKSKFYIAIGEPHLWCVFDECCLEGTLIKSMGGWIQGERTSQPTIAEIFGLDSSDNNKKFESIVIVGDGNSKIVGIYPGKSSEDISSIMKLHSVLIGL